MRFPLLVAMVGWIFSAVYTAEGLLSQNYNQDEFQVATAYLKDHDPALFPKDFIWSQPEMIRNLHLCIRVLMRITDALTFGLFSEPIDLFLLWLPICVFSFFSGIYLLCLRFSGDQLASLLVACSFMLVRRVIWDWWGVGPVFDTVSARGVVLSFLPLALWAYFLCEEHPGGLACCFLVWGLISNLHPLSGWGFVELLGITILIAERFSLRSWMQVVIMTAATILGSLPFLMIWSSVITMPTEMQASATVIKEFWDGFMGLEIPPAKFIQQFLEDLAVPLLLSVAGFVFWRRLGPTSKSHGLRLLYFFPCVVVGMTLTVMLAGYLLKIQGISLPIMVPEHSRNLKFVYLTLPIWMAVAITHWFRLWTLASWWMRYGVPVVLLIASMAINFPGHKLARTLLLKAGWLSSPLKEEVLERERENAADLEVARWARKNTAGDALFYFDSYEFRYYARRSLVFCLFDRPCVGFRPTHDLEEWIHRRDRLVPIKKVRDSEAALMAARMYKADFVVIPKDWKSLRQNPVWSNWKYSVYQVK